MTCIKCHNEIMDGSIYCSFCGKKQVSEKASRTRRSNGQGTVYKRGNCWQAEITLGYYIEDGKLKRKRLTKSGFTKKKDALDYISVLRSETQKKQHIAISELWEQFKSGHYMQLSASKQSSYRMAYKKIKSKMSHRNIDSISADELQKLVDEVGTSYYTKRDIKVLFSQLYKIAMRDDYVAKNKAEFISLPKCETEERDIFTGDEINRIWEEYKAESSRISAHVLIMLYTGMRPGELLNAQIANVNLSEHYLTGGIKTEKGKKRKIIIPDKIIPVFEWLISGSGGKKLTTYKVNKEFYDEFRAFQSKLKLNPKLVPYCCRHTYVTNATKLNISPALLQELVGHEDYETTLSYTHLSVQDRLDAVNQL